MTELLDEILKLLSDGEWHSINEIVSITNGRPLKVLLCLNFLEDYNFIEIDRNAREIRLRSTVKLFLDDIKKLEE